MESVSITPDKKTTTESALADTTNSNPSQTSQSKRFQPLVEDDHSGDDVPGETGQGSTTTSGKLANNAATEALSENTTNPVMQNLGGTASRTTTRATQGPIPPYHPPFDLGARAPLSYGRPVGQISRSRNIRISSYDTNLHSGSRYSGAAPRTRPPGLSLPSFQYHALPAPHTYMTDRYSQSDLPLPSKHHGPSQGANNIVDSAPASWTNTLASLGRGILSLGKTLLSFAASGILSLLPGTKRAPRSGHHTYPLHDDPYTAYDRLLGSGSTTYHLPHEMSQGYEDEPSFYDPTVLTIPDGYSQDGPPTYHGWVNHGWVNHGGPDCELIGDFIYPQWASYFTDHSKASDTDE